MFTERRWERHHSNGWSGIIFQTDENGYEAYVDKPTGERSLAFVGSNFDSAKTAAQRNVLMSTSHEECLCPDWEEVPFSTD